MDLDTSYYSLVTLILYNSVVDAAQKYCPSVLSQAQQIKSKYQRLLNLFHNCHAIYNNQNAISDEPWYATYFSLYSVGSSPCLFSKSAHQNLYVLLLDYFSRGNSAAQDALSGRAHGTWLRKWHIGFRVMGEQGAESIPSIHILTPCAITSNAFLSLSRE